MAVSDKSRHSRKVTDDHLRLPTVLASIEDRVFYFSKVPFGGSSIRIFRGGSSIRADLKNKSMPKLFFLIGEKRDIT